MSQRYIRIRASSVWPLLGLLLSCGDPAPIVGSAGAQVVVHVLTGATVRTVVVDVSGPGISPALTANIPVGADSVASGSLTIPAGSGRRLVVTAVDTAGITTHRADTTISVVSGANPPLRLRLAPLPSTLGITVTFGGARVSVADTSARDLLIGDTIRIAASGLSAAGSVVLPSALSWSVSNPAIIEVVGGRVRGLREGVGEVVVSHAGASARVRIRVAPFLLIGGNNLPTETDVSVTGRLDGPGTILRQGRLFFQYAYSGVQPVIFAAYFSGPASTWENWTSGENILSHVSFTGTQWRNTIRIGTGAGIATSDLVIDVVGDESRGVYVFPWYGVSLTVRTGGTTTGEVVPP